MTEINFKARHLMSMNTVLERGTVINALTGRAPSFDEKAALERVSTALMATMAERGFAESDSMRLLDPDGFDVDFEFAELLALVHLVDRANGDPELAALLVGGLA